MEVHPQEILLDSSALDAAIGVVGRAGQAFALGRGERRAYQLLTLGVDLMMVGFTVVLVVSFSPLAADSVWFEGLLFAGILSIVIGTLGSLVGLLASLPLVLHLARQRRALRAHGVTALSRTLWKVGRRRHRLDRIRRFLSSAYALLMLAWVGIAVERGPHDEGWQLGLFSAASFVAVIGAWTLRNRVEQVDLASSASALQQALQVLRAQGGSEGRIAVPADLIDRAAQIELARIARERAEVLSRSVTSGKRPIAVEFSDRAAQQRAALDPDARIDLEDLLARLSAGGVQTAGSEASANKPQRRSGVAGLIEVFILVDPDRGRLTVDEILCRSRAAATGVNNA